MSKDQDYSKVIEEQEITDEGRSFAVEDNDLDHYVGVSPEYMTYANETEKPMLTDDEIDALEAADEGDQENPAVPPVEEPKADDEPAEDEAPEPETTNVGGGDPAPAAPPA